MSGHGRGAAAEDDLAARVADRPLGPVFECLFEECGLRIHLSVVRGGVELLELGRERVSDLLLRWLGDSPTGTDTAESMLLQAVAGAPGNQATVAGMRRLAPSFTADLVARDLVDDGALGASVRVGDDAAFVGIPPRAEGWRVQVPGPGERPQLLAIHEGGVATRGFGSGRVTITADRAWRAAAEAERLAAGSCSAGHTGAVWSSTRSAPA